MTLFRHFLAATLLLLALAPGRAQTPAQLQSADAPAGTIWLDSVDISKARQGYGQPRAGRSVDDHPLTLAGVVYPHGLGTHSVGRLIVKLHGAATRFTSLVGVDDETGGKGSVIFSVVVDGKTQAQTGVLHGGDRPQFLSVDLTGAQTLILRVGDAGDGYFFDHADWAGALITLAPNATSRPETYQGGDGPPRLVIPPPDPRPAIHNPHIIGATPGRPFLLLIPATGDGPLTYSAKNLPAGLTLDAKTGLITGALQRAGTASVMLTVRGPKGMARHTLIIIGGDHKLALTPPMGWNSWNVWATTVDAGKVRAAADEMIASGLARHGFQYINIDEGWDRGTRDAQGRLQPQPSFGDMHGMTAYVHRKGLRVGIYSSPGPFTCDGPFCGSWQHEDQDAATFADWGFDYLKYDWCTYGNVVHGSGQAYFQHPYAVMRASLDKVPHDIVFSFCQYGMGEVWTWGARTGGNSWRTHGDIDDNWQSLHDIYEHEAGHEVYASPGHWNDPDMLMVGVVGKGSPHPTHLTPNEQILHISLWCLVSSPLLIGCDMTRMDPFTLALLSNDEALDINQDPLGRAAGRVAQDGDLEVWARPLSDGTRAVGLVNGGDDPATVTARWADIGVKGRQPVRDLWLHRDVGTFDSAYSVQVPAHGCALLKIGRAR
ncbi:MAG: NPCBM/NEW2 domain-containing protein [Armatimonadetes bacterium]|nr:NPCBM/NEW2 domain-containing protein [Armatimonadota bacterium]